METKQHKSDLTLHKHPACSPPPVPWLPGTSNRTGRSASWPSGRTSSCGRRTASAVRWAAGLRRCLFPACSGRLWIWRRAFRVSDRNARVSACAASISPGPASGCRLSWRWTLWTPARTVPGPACSWGGPGGRSSFRCPSGPPGEREACIGLFEVSKKKKTKMNSSFLRSCSVCRKLIQILKIFLH